MNCLYCGTPLGSPDRYVDGPEIYTVETRCDACTSISHKNIPVLEPEPYTQLEEVIIPDEKEKIQPRRRGRPLN